MRVLVTGMSGTGKSSVVAGLRERGQRAHDVDDGLSAPDPSDGRWHWRTDEIRRLLDDSGTATVSSPAAPRSRPSSTGTASCC